MDLTNPVVLKRDVPPVRNINRYETVDDVVAKDRLGLAPIVPVPKDFPQQMFSYEDYVSGPPKYYPRMPEANQLKSATELGAKAISAIIQASQDPINDLSRPTVVDANGNVYMWDTVTHQFVYQYHMRMKPVANKMHPMLLDEQPKPREPTAQHSPRLEISAMRKPMDPPPIRNSPFVH